MNSLAWRVAARADATTEEFTKALLKTRAACSLDPTSPYHQNTLGVLLYRTGRFVDAMEALQTSHEMVVTRTRPYSLVFMAMAARRLGRGEQARELLTQVVALVDGSEDAEQLGFLGEARQLIEGPAGQGRDGK